MDWFDNDFTPDGRPICPVCGKSMHPDTGDTAAYTGPHRIMVIAHIACVEK